MFVEVRRVVTPKEGDIGNLKMLKRFGFLNPGAGYMWLEFAKFYWAVYLQFMLFFLHIDKK